MRHADEVRRLEVRANADTPDDARHAIHRGAQGVGLCRTEHMFLGERKQFVQNLILADSDDEREKALAMIRERAARYPGERVDRQPVHTVYVPADRFGAGTPVVGRRHSRANSRSIEYPGPASVAVADGSAGTGSLSSE